MTDSLPPLPDHVDALLRAARDASVSPPTGVEDLVLAKVAASVAPVAAVAATAQLGAGAGKAAAWGMGKSIAAVVVGAVIGGGALLVVANSGDHRTAPASETDGMQAAASASPPTVEATRAALPAVPAAPMPPPLTAPPSPTVSAPPVSAPPVSVPVPRAPEQAAVPNPAEGVLLEAAREALALGDAALARDKLVEHERRFPSGQLREERRALTVVALVQLGERERARLAARAFEAQHPHSLFLEVVRGALTE